MHFENTSTQLCSRADCSIAEFTDDWCDLEGERHIANWKTRDALTKHLKFVEFHQGQIAALMPILHTKDIHTSEDSYKNRKILVH